MPKFQSREELENELATALDKVIDLTDDVLSAEGCKDRAEEERDDLKHRVDQTVNAVIEFLQMISDGKKVNDAASIVTKTFEIDRHLEDAMYRFTLPKPSQAAKKPRKK